MGAVSFKETAIVRNGRAPKVELPKIPHFECRFVPPDHSLAQWWEFVRLGVEDLLKKVRPEGFYTFRPEDVYVAIRAKQVVLYVVFLDGKLTGFGITRRAEDAFLNAEPYLLSWLGWCDKREATDLYFRELENVARGLKLKEIRHYSTRKGWILAPPNRDWEIQTAEGWKGLKTDAERRELFKAFKMVPEVCMRRRIV